MAARLWSIYALVFNSEPLLQEPSILECYKWEAVNPLAPCSQRKAAGKSWGFVAGVSGHSFLFPCLPEIL